MNELELTGRAMTHLVPVDAFETFLQLPVLRAFESMRQAALKDGVTLKIVSGYRDFDRQLSIWNRKFLGETQLVDRKGNVVKMLELNDSQRVHAVLTWVMFPGGSRHHWGTDIDVMDVAAVDPDYELQLGVHEYYSGGVFNRMYEWLKDNARQWDFYFPYDADRAGVAVEPWHISYGPLAEECLNAFNSEMLREAIKGAKVEGKQYLLENVDRLFHQYVTNVGRFNRLLS